MRNIKKAISDEQIIKDDVINMMYESYGCTEDGISGDLGNQYKIKIDTFVNLVFERICDKNWTEENIFEGFSSMGYRIMNSLRDTDTQLIIELEG